MTEVPAALSSTAESQPALSVIETSFSNTVICPTLNGFLNHFPCLIVPFGTNVS